MICDSWVVCQRGWLPTARGRQKQHFCELLTFLWLEMFIWDVIHNYSSSCHTFSNTHKFCHQKFFLCPGKLKVCMKTTHFLLRGWVIIGKTSIFAYFRHFDGIVSHHWDIFRKNLFYEKGPVWYYLQ